MGRITAMHVCPDNGGPGGDIPLWHLVEDLPGECDVATASVASDHGVVGDDVSVGNLVEQEQGVGERGEGVSMEEGGGDMNAGEEVGLEEEGVEGGEDAASRGDG